MASATRPTTLDVNLDDLAKMIDHSLLHPTMIDDDILAGLEACKICEVATGELSLILCRRFTYNKSPSLRQALPYTAGEEKNPRHIRPHPPSHRIPSRKFNN